MKKTNDNEFLSSFGKNENGRGIEIKKPYIHLVYFKWHTQPDNNICYNLSIKKADGHLVSEYPRKRSELSELRREKLIKISQLSSMWNQLEIHSKNQKGHSRALQMGTPENKKDLTSL